jgi:predicted nucleotidyltransferase
MRAWRRIPPPVGGHVLEQVTDLGERVIELLERHPAVQSVRLVGSRAEGRAVERSDWDFLVESEDFPAAADALPDLLAALDPLAQQWDPLSTQYCWMLMLRGPVKIDLIFADQPHEPEPRRTPTHNNLAAIDAHFWDWILWLSGKHAAAKHDVVGQELQKLFADLLGPLGVTRQPLSLHEAVEVYRVARDKAEARFGCVVPRALEREVAPLVPG